MILKGLSGQTGPSVSLFNYTTSHLHEVEQRANNPEQKHRGPLGKTARSCSAFNTDGILLCVCVYRKREREREGLSCNIFSGETVSFTRNNKELNQSGNLTQLQHERTTLGIFLFSPFTNYFLTCSQKYQINWSFLLYPFLPKKGGNSSLY